MSGNFASLLKILRTTKDTTNNYLMLKEKFANNEITEYEFESLFSSLINTNHVYDVDAQNILDEYIMSRYDINEINDSNLFTIIKTTNNKFDLMLVIYILIRPKVLHDNQQDIKDLDIRVKNNIDKLIEIISELNINCFKTVNDFIYVHDLNYNYYHVYNGLNNKELYQKITKLWRLLCKDLTYINPYYKNTNKTNNKPKIGFISSFLVNDHSVCKDRIGVIFSLIMSGLYDIYIFSKDSDEETLYKKLNSIANFNNKIILPNDFVESRDIIAKHNFDVIVYPEIGMDTFFYFMAFSRLAPIQINTWGHSETSGIDTIDYYFSSKYYEDESSQKYYNEKLVLLDSLCTYYYGIKVFDYYSKINNTNQANLLPIFNLPSNCTKYGLFQTVYKYHPDNFYIIKEILYNDPKAIIILLTHPIMNKRFLSYLEKHLGYHVNRIKILPRLDTENYCKLIKSVDIVLDSYPFGGCNTSLEAFALGKMVLTLPSDKLNGRFTYGFYKKMGITEPICSSIDDFIKKALYYANNKSDRDMVENKIKKNSDKLFQEKDSIVTWQNKLNELIDLSRNTKSNIGSKSISIVVARYNEDLKWTLEEPFNKFKYIVYNKGDNDNFEKTNVESIITLPNVGKCDHTYLYHVYNSYDNLADINVFLPGSIDMENKKNKAKSLLHNILISNRAVFECIEAHSIKTQLYNFTLDVWATSHDKNLEKNETVILEKSPIRPFGKWFENKFGEIDIKHLCFMGIFSIGKEDIKQHDKNRYLELLNELNHINPEVGHYIERSWAAIFYPLNDTQIITT